MADEYVFVEMGCFFEKSVEFQQPGQVGGRQRGGVCHREPAVDEDILFGFDKRGQTLQKCRFARQMRSQRLLRSGDVGKTAQRQAQFVQRLGDQAAARMASADVYIAEEGFAVPVGVQHREGERVDVPHRRINGPLLAQLHHIAQRAEAVRSLLDRVADEEEKVVAGFITDFLQQRLQQRKMAVYVADGDDPAAFGQGEEGGMVFHCFLVPFLINIGGLFSGKRLLCIFGVPDPLICSYFGAQRAF